MGSVSPGYTCNFHLQLTPSSEGFINFGVIFEINQLSISVLSYLFFPGCKTHFIAQMDLYSAKRTNTKDFELNSGTVQSYTIINTVLITLKIDTCAG